MADGSPMPVPLTLVGSNRAHTPGVLPSKERLCPDELLTVDGLSITHAVRSVLFEMRHAPTLLAAVTHLDMACYNDLVSLTEVAAWLDANKGWTGIQQARDALALADENTWSPAESALRLSGPGPASSVRSCATCPSSISTASTWSPPTCSIRSWASLGNTKGRTTSIVISDAGTLPARLCCATTGWSTSSG